MSQRPQRSVGPPARFKDYTEMVSSDENVMAPKTTSNTPMSESLTILQSALNVMRDDSFHSAPFVASISPTMPDVFLSQSFGEQDFGTALTQSPFQDSLNSPYHSQIASSMSQGERRSQIDKDQLEAERRRKAEQEQLDAERRRQVEQDRLEAARRQSEGQDQLVAERRRKAEQEQLDAERRRQVEQDRSEAARRQQEEQDQLEAERRRKAEQEQLDAERRRQVEQDQLESARWQQAEQDQLEAERRRKAEQEQLDAERRRQAEQNQLDVERQPVLNDALIVQLLQAIRDEQRKLERSIINLAKSVEREAEFPTKPDSLPVRTRQDIDNFETVDDEEYKKVVTYLADLGGYNLNETANIIVKHAIEDSLSPSLTWQGREQGSLKLQETKLAKAFYSAVSRNKAFASPTLREFTDCMTAALKSCKQRNRNAVHRQRATGGIRRP